MSKHGGPQLDELALVEATVLVLVEHLDEVARHLLVESHLVLDDGRHLLRAQHPVAVLVQLVETGRDLLVDGLVQSRCLPSSRTAKINITQAGC